MKYNPGLHRTGTPGKEREEPWLWGILACPWCGGELEPEPVGALCTKCGEKHERTCEGRLDLRIKRAKRVKMEVEVGGQPGGSVTEPFRILGEKAGIADHFKGVPLPRHFSVEMLRQFPVGARGSVALDLGCGTGEHRELCRRAGFQWVGVDISPSSEATVLADAHALPFQSEVFDLVLSVAVLEHLAHPFVAVGEVQRVLRLKGCFMGTVAFLEPYHSNSHYHHSHLGVLACLQAAGLKVQWISPQSGWDALHALAGQLFPRAPRGLARGFVGPTRLLHTLWWLGGRLLSAKGSMLEHKRLFSLAGAFVFKALKE